MASFDPATSSWRTSRISFDFDPQEDSQETSGERFSEGFPRSGSMSSGTVYPLRPSAPLTDVIGSSPLLGTPTSHPRTHTPRQVDHGAQLANEVFALLPTPTAQDGSNVAGPSQLERNTPPLNAVVRLLPTPMARDGRPDGSQNRRSAASVAAGGGESVEQAALKLLPTPTAALQDGNGMRIDPPIETPVGEWEFLGAPTVPPSDAGKKSTDLRLSPWFVEWMMGAPDGWSDPGCLLSATEFRSRSASSPGGTSSSASGSE